MQAAPVLLTVAALWLAALTPGPNSVLIMRVSVGPRWVQALWAVAGIGAGTCIWGLSGFFGVHALFRAAPFLY